MVLGSSALMLLVVLLLVSELSQPTAGRPRLEWAVGTSVVALLAIAARTRSRWSSAGVLRHLAAANLEQLPGWRVRRFAAVAVTGTAAASLVLGAWVVSPPLGERVTGWLQVPLVRLDGNVLHFSDLAQFYGAASCSKPVQVGQDVCDPAHRVLNQSPALVHLVAPVAHHAGLVAVGVALMVLVIVVVSLLAASTPHGHLVAIPLLGSPAAALAFERGNLELLMFVLVAAGVFLLSRPRARPLWVLGGLLVLTATVLKVFPAVFLVPFLVFGSPGRRTVAAVALACGVGYWLLNADTLSVMLAVTQRGTTDSYGIDTILPYSSKVVPIAAAVTTMALGLVLARRASAADVLGARNQALALGFSCFYLFSFFSGANWSYRLFFAALLTGAGVAGLVGLQTVLALVVMWLSPGGASGVPQLALAAVAFAIVVSAASRMLATTRPDTPVGALALSVRTRLSGHATSNSASVSG
ncbi:MAG: hypothetical protein JWR20_167 [Marmoricola sp.]|nr:hypothetical protein [Marmoricola sp.]